MQLFPPWNSHVKDGLVVLLLLILRGGEGITNAQRFLVKLPVSSAHYPAEPEPLRTFKAVAQFPGIEELSE